MCLRKERPYTHLIRTPHNYGQFALCLRKESPYTRLIRTPHYYGQFALSLGKESPYTRLIRTPHYYGQFALCLGKECPNVFSKFNPLNTDTPLIWRLSMAPSVSILTEFDCINRGTQRQFSENICSEDDWRSRIFGTFFAKFLACLPLLGFSNI